MILRLLTKARKTLLWEVQFFRSKWFPPYSCARNICQSRERVHNIAVFLRRPMFAVLIQSLHVKSFVQDIVTKRGINTILYHGKQGRCISWTMHFVSKHRCNCGLDLKPGVEAICCREFVVGPRSCPKGCVGFSLLNPAWTKKKKKKLNVAYSSCSICCWPNCSLV